MESEPEKNSRYGKKILERLPQQFLGAGFLALYGINGDAQLVCNLII